MIIVNIVRWYFTRVLQTPVFELHQFRAYAVLIDVAYDMMSYSKSASILQSFNPIAIEMPATYAVLI